MLSTTIFFILITILFQFTSTTSTPITGWIMPHSHCDLGWVQTIDEYYEWNVTKILNGIVQWLPEDSSRRFVWAETAYLYLWWTDTQTTKHQKATWIDLVCSKKIEHVSGDWVQPDQATVNLPETVNQMALGKTWLFKEILSKCKTKITLDTSYSIDPFGQSTAYAMYSAQDHFKYYIIDRIDARLKYVYQSIPGSGEMATNKELEFFWFPSPNQPDTNIFTHILDHHYVPPYLTWEQDGKQKRSGFDFEAGGPENPSINSSNIEERAWLLVNITKLRADEFRTQNVLLPAGNDFRYQQPQIEWPNWELLINYINANVTKFGIQLQFCTPREYFEAIGVDNTSFPWPNRTADQGDFFPYATNWESFEQGWGDGIGYWTGYYSSRITEMKKYTRINDAQLRAANALYTQLHAHRSTLPSSTWTRYFDEITLSAQAQAYMCHHDNLPGTSVDKNWRDLDTRLSNGIKATSSALGNMMQHFFTLDTTSFEPSIQYGIGNVQQQLDQNHAVGVTFFNSLGHIYDSWISIPLATVNICPFSDPNLKHQIRTAEIIENPEYFAIKEGLVKPINMSANFENFHPPISRFNLYIRLDVAPLGYKTIYLKSQGCLKFTPAIQINTSATPSFNISSDYVSLSFKSAPMQSGTETPGYYVLDKYCSGKVSKSCHFLSQQFSLYESLGGGAYIFRPKQQSVPLTINSDKTWFVEGQFVSSVFQVLSSSGTTSTGPNVAQSFTLFNGEYDGSTEYQISAFAHQKLIVNVKGQEELISRWTTDLQTHGMWYTDDGYEEHLRKYVPVRWGDVAEFNKIAGNYYPMVSHAAIEQDAVRFSLLSAESHGASSQSNGTLEVMLIRSTLQSDGCGMGQPLNDTSTLRTTMRFGYGLSEFLESIRPLQSLQLQYPLSPFTVMNSKEWDHWYTSHSGLTTPLPPAIHLLSFGPWPTDHSATVLRFYHMFAQGQGSPLDEPVFLNLDEVFEGYVLDEFDAKSLSGYTPTGYNSKEFTLSTKEIVTFFTLLHKSAGSSPNINPASKSWFNSKSFAIGIGATMAFFLLIFAVYAYRTNRQIKQTSQNSNSYSAIEQGDKDVHDSNLVDEITGSAIQ